MARLASMISRLADVHVAVRVTATHCGRVDRQVRLFAPASREGLLRRAIGSFVAFDRIGGDISRLPLDRDEYDAMIRRFPSRSATISLPRQETPGGAWLSSGFRLAPSIPKLVEDARALGFGFAYQAQVSPLEPDRQAIRQARYNLLNLRRDSPIPAGMLAEQERLVDSYQRATRLVREVVSVDDSEAEQWLVDAITRLFRDASSSNLDGPSFEFGAIADLDLAIHPTVTDEDFARRHPDEACREGASEAIFNDLLGWQPPSIPRTPGPPEEQEERPGSDPSIFSDLPAPDGEGQGYVFISYPHRAIGRMKPLFDRLRSARAQFWYDRDLIGGVEWDSELEDRIRRSRMLLACISQDAIDSKYCRREIKFADALDLPILAVMISPAELRHGMAMLLRQYQHLDYAAPDFGVQLQRALDRALN